MEIQNVLISVPIGHIPRARLLALVRCYKQAYVIETMVHFDYTVFLWMLER